MKNEVHWSFRGPIRVLSKVAVESDEGPSSNTIDYLTFKQGSVTHARCIGVWMAGKYTPLWGWELEQYLDENYSQDEEFRLAVTPVHKLAEDGDQKLEHYVKLDKAIRGMLEKKREREIAFERLFGNHI